MIPVLHYAFAGFNQPEVILLLSRLVVGGFCIFSGYNKLFNPGRHGELVKTLKACGIPLIGFNQWFVPIVEFFGGWAVVTGFLAPLAAIGLIVIFLVAIGTDGLKRIREAKPINVVDYFCYFFYQAEIIFTVMLVGIVIAGPGSYSLYGLMLRYTHLPL